MRYSSIGSIFPRSRWGRRSSGLLGLTALALAGSAALVHSRAAKAEREYPPKGMFLEADGVRLHYLERGRGRPVVFLHGNGAMIEDMLISGVFDQTSGHFRAIAFDRPGFGHSERPRQRAWTAAAQARLFARAFAQLGIEQPIVVGHSWGTLVALSLALNHRNSVGGLVLASGYYFPTARADVVLFSPPSIPLAGDLLSHTIAPLVGEVISPALIKKMFAPQPVSPRFEREYPLPLALRPSQVKAFSEEASHMVAAAEQLCGRYREITCPTLIMAGDADRIVDVERQPKRLHGAIPGSRIDIFSGAGHMLHHVAPERVVRGIEYIANGGITTATMKAERATWGT